MSRAQTWNTIVNVGPGYPDTNTRQVVRTSGGTVYIFVIAAVLNGSGASSIRTYKGSPAGNPTSFAEVAAASRPSNSVRFGAVEARIGVGGTMIDVVYEDDATLQMVYRQFNTSTDTWGTAETIATLSGFTNNRYQSKLALCLDSNSVPHVFYGASNGNTLLYTNRIGGTWAAGFTVSTTTGVRRTGCVFDGSGNLHAAYWSNSPPTIRYRQRQSSGTWLSEELVDNVDVTGTADDQGVSIVLDSQNRPTLFYAGLSVNPDGNTYQIRVRTAASTYTSANPPGVVGHSPAGYIDFEGNLYAFIGHDDNPIEPFVIVRNAQTQAWGTYTQLAPNPPPTRDSSASIRYDPVWPGSTADIDALFNEEQISGTGQTWYVHGTAPSGPAQPPAVSLSATSLTFGSQVVGSTSAARVVSLTNTGGSTLTITSIALGGANAADFAETNTCGTSVGAGASCTISVTFKPTGVGSRVGSVVVTDNAMESPHTVGLTGAGTDFTVGPAAGTPSTVSVGAGQTASYALVVAPVNGFTGMVTVSCSGAPTAAVCTVMPNSVSINGGVANLSVDVTTTARGEVLPPTPVGRWDWRPIPVGLLGLAVLLVLTGMSRRRQGQRQWRPVCRLATASLGVLGLASGLMLAGCTGSGTSQPPPPSQGTPAGTYTLTISASSQSSTRTTSLTLQVQ